MKVELESLLRRALNYADEKGNQTQQYDMAGVVAQIAQSAGELEDFERGVRHPKLHPHHKPEDLRQAVIDGKRTLGQVCREIVNSNLSKRSAPKDKIVARSATKP